jgi:hypothetical protein
MKKRVRRAAEFIIPRGKRRITQVSSKPRKPKTIPIKILCLGETFKKRRFSLKRRVRTIKSKMPAAPSEKGAARARTSIKRVIKRTVFIIE